MLSRGLLHDAASCHLCEAVSPNSSRRHWKHEPKAGWWHVIADGDNLMARLPRLAHFVTVLSYQIGVDGRPVRYDGPFHFEFDADDPVYALNDVRQCIQILDVEYGCPFEAIHLWHSGGRGFHVTIPSIVVGAEAGHPFLPHLYGAMIQQLFPPHIVLSLDRSIYNMGKGRMWRLPNRRRFDTGRYKVPLSTREVLHKPFADLEALTLRPRKGIFWPPDDDLSPCPGLLQLYQETAGAIERAAFLHPSPDRQELGLDGDVHILLNRCTFLRHCRDNAATLSEPEWYSMVSNVARCRHGAEAVHQLSAPYPGYSSQETEQKIAHALADAGPHTCAFIRALGFQGCPSGGCRVKAPIGLSRPSWHKSIAGGQSSSGYAPPPPIGGLYVPSASRTTRHTAREGRYV